MDLCVVSYWIDILVLKNWGKYLRYFTASSSPLRGNPTQCSRGSKKNFWRRCRGVYAQVKTYQVPITNSYPSHYIICHLPLVFLSPTSPLPFYSPSLSQSPSLLPIFLFPFAFLFACVLDYLLPWCKIIPNRVISRIPIIMISLVLRLLLLMMLSLVKPMLLCWILLWKINSLAFLVKMPLLI